MLVGRGICLNAVGGVVEIQNGRRRVVESRRAGGATC